jgi:phosphatidyl-myo-inositol dimannoside synthase
MKVLFISADIRATGGIQQYNREFITALREHGIKVTELEVKKRTPIEKIRTLTKVLWHGVVINHDLIICAHINYSPFGYFIKKLSKRPYIICTHGVDAWNVKNPAQIKALREASLVTTVAHYTRDRLIAQVPELNEKIYMLLSFVDGERFTPQEKSPELVKRYGLENKKVILTVARLSAEEGYKGYDRIIQALPQILKKVPNAHYVLVGKGDDAERVEKLVKEMSMENHVMITGYVPTEEIVAHYNLSDVFAMPSKSEGAPAVFLEALACGKPVIAGNQDGSGTPLQNGKTGLLIDPESITEIAEAIIKVFEGKVAHLSDPKFLRESTLETFSLKAFKKRVKEVIDLAQEPNPTTRIV